MAFVDQVQDLTSLTVSDTDELSQFLKDGVLDVTNRWLAVKPQDIELFGRETSEQTSNGSLNLNGARIISVIREDGVTSNNWRPCRKISVNQQYLATDTESLSFASKFNPVYMVGDAGKISVFPAPGSDPNTFKAYYVNKDPVNSSGSALIHSHDDILYFPIDKAYLVVMYAGIRLLHAAMGATTITDLSLNPVPPDVPTIVDVSFADATAGTVAAVSLAYENTAVGGTAPVYSSGSVVGFGSLLKTLANLSVSSVPPDTPSDPTIASAYGPTVTVGSLGTAPTYTEQSLTAQTTFNAFFESGSLNPLDDSDPGSFSVSAVPPDTPSLSNIVYTSINSDNDVDATLVQVATSDTLTGATSVINVPTYDKPAIDAEGGELVDLRGDDSQIDFNDWFNIVGDYIETNEDTELAGAQIQKISTYIQAYGQAMQNNLNEFNEANVKFQASVQESMGEFQSANQIAISNAERSQNRQLQTAISDMKVIFDNNAQAIQKYNSDLQSYQADVNSQVQEQGQNMQRYQTELNTVYQAWAKTESDNLQKYQLDLQNKLNEFNEANVLYQTTVQKAIQDAQINAQEKQKEGDLDLQAAIQDYTLELQKYQADVTVYQAEVNKEVQEWQTSTDLALRQHAQSMQDNLNVFNEDNAAYQANLQHTLARIQAENNVNIQEAQIELQDKMKDADLATQVSMQAAISDMQAIVAKNESRISKYTAELQSYQAEVAAAVQEYTQNLQGDGMGYQWLQDQYNRLKAEYDQAFLIAAPKQQERRQA